MGILLTAVSQCALAFGSLYITNYDSIWSAPLWPASGAALGAVLLGGPWMLVGVFFGLLPTQFFFWGVVPYTSAILLPFANVLETALAWLLLQKFAQGFNNRLQTQKDLVNFLVLAPWVPSLLSATLAQSLLHSTDQLPDNSMLNEVLAYALGNASGIVLITPIILVWRDVFPLVIRLDRISLKAIFLSLTVAFAVWEIQREKSFFPVIILFLPPLIIWGVWSTGLKGAVLNCCAISFLFFSIEQNIPFDLRLIEKHSRIEKVPPSNPNPFRKTEKTSFSFLEDPFALQFTLLTVFCLTLYPLGLASDTLRANAKKDRLIMEALKSSLWSWNSVLGYQIESTSLRQQITEKTPLFKENQSSGQLVVPNINQNAPNFVSHWLTTELSQKGTPTQVIGILYSIEDQEKVYHAEKNAALAKLEVQALRARLNPHLLFNSLTGLRALIRQSPKQASRFTEKLACFLRSAIDTQSHSLISLQQEINLCKEYLLVMHFRGEKVDLVFHVPKSTLAIEIPPMTIQALVENALKHGHRSRDKRMRIGVTVRHVDPKSVSIRVSNLGSLAQTITDSPGTGLTIVRHHLRVFFNGQAHLSLTEKPKGRVTAIIHLPKARQTA